MAATLAAARGAFPGRRLVLAFQPHRYTRTRDCFEDFVKVLGGVDALLLAEVYAAGEAPIVAADARSLVRALRVAGKVEPVFVEEIAAMPAAILAAAKDGDVVITMGGPVASGKSMGTARRSPPRAVPRPGSWRGFPARWAVRWR
jgi:UDP-N-acetylmuramate--alanine ligase